jgi:IS5 family transposase
MVRGVCHQGRYDAIKGAQRTAALLHEPSDSRLLWDAVRVMVRLVKAADAFRRPSPMAQSLARGEEAGAGDRVCSRSTDRVQHYRELIKLAQAGLSGILCAGPV